MTGSKLKKPTIGIIGGKGIIGNFLVSFFKERKFPVLFSDVKTPISNKKCVQLSDVVIVSVPMHKTREVIREIIPLLRPEQLIADVTSLKVFTTKEMLKSKAEVIGMHPLFRPTKNGFKNQNMVLCPVRVSQKNLAWLKGLFEKAGATVITMTPKKHDDLMGIIQVLIHFHSIVLGQTLRALKTPLQTIMEIMSPIYRLQFDVVCRIFAQDPMLYASIGMENPQTKKITKTFIQKTELLQKILLEKNVDGFVKEFKKTVRFLGPYSQQALKESDELIASFKKIDN